MQKRQKNDLNTIQEIKHLLLKHNTTPSGAIKLTGISNQLDKSTQQKQNDVTHTKQNTHTKEHALALLNSETNCLN